MKKYLPILTLGFLFASSVCFAQSVEPPVSGSGVLQTTVKTEPIPGGTLTTTEIHGTDSLAMGDPLGNRGMTAKHDAGPALTQRPYTDNCMEDRCIRAAKRQLSPTSWQQDRATGLSLGFNERAE